MSTFGSGATGSRKNAMPPANASASVSRVVATGRWMNGAEIFMAWRCACRDSALGRCWVRTAAERTAGRLCASPSPRAAFVLGGQRRPAAAHRLRQPIEEQVDHWRREQGEDLADEQPTD